MTEAGRPTDGIVSQTAIVRGRLALRGLARAIRGRYASPLVLLTAAILAHGLLIPRLGFYWDDWPKIWFLSRLGPGGFWAVYASDRPFLPWIYMLTTPILGTIPWHWQVFGLIARWLCAVSVWWTVLQLWPGRRKTALAVALLFVVYPGFRSGPVAVIYSHFFALMALTILSLGVMLRTLRRGAGRFWTPVALLASALSLFSVEYFVGYELLRPILAWVVAGESGRLWRTRLRRAVAAWFPYVPMFALYIVWRVFFWKFPTYQPLGIEAIAGSFWQGLGSLGEGMGTALLRSGLLAWVEAFQLPAVPSLGLRSAIVYAFVVAGLGSGTLLYLMLGGQEDYSGAPTSPAKRRIWGLQAIGIGLLAMITGGLPIWVTGLQVELLFPWDRLTMPMMLGASVVVVGVLSLLTGNRIIQAIILATLVGAAGGLHLQSDVSYARDWDSQKDLLWQMSWRMPSLQPGTTLLTNDIHLYESDNSLTSPLNWMYAPSNFTLRMDYMFYYVSVRLGRGLTGVQPGLPIYQTYRAASFEGSTSMVLAALYAPLACFHVLDVVLDDSMPTVPRLVSSIVPLSRLDLIEPRPAQPARPPVIVGPEPTHGWCYYFERADLARQEGNWAQVAALGDIALSLSDHPNDASERIPFIEGYAHVGRWDRAMELTDEAMQHNSAVARMLCNAWNRIARDLRDVPAGEEPIRRVWQELRCPSS